MKVQVEIDTDKLPTQDEIVDYVCEHFLTERQAVLYKGAAKGKTNGEIARDLGNTKKITESNITDAIIKVNEVLRLLEFANPCNLYQGGYDKAWGWKASI